MLNWHRRAKEQLLKESLTKMASEMPDCEVIYVHSEKRGRITKKLLSELVSPEILRMVTYCAYCGSEGFNKSVKKTLEELGYNNRVHEFGYDGL